MSAPLHVGIQVGSHSIYDEGVERLLDTIQDTAGANAIYAYSHDYGGFAPNRRPEDLADHGVWLPAPASRRFTPVWSPPNSSFYGDTPLRHVRDPADDFADRDLFAELVPAARARGIAIHARWLESSGENRVSGWDAVREVGVDGTALASACFRNPGYQAWHVATVRDLLSTYDLDGFHFGAERNGPLTQALLWGGPVQPGCFCEHCRAAADEQGIDVEAARRGYRELARFRDGFKDRTAPSAWVAMLAVFLRYPDVLAWERLWQEGKDTLRRAIHDTAKAIRPSAEVGWHLWHYTTSMDIFARASLDYAALAKHSDYIKPVVYHDVAGSRLHGLITHAYAKRVLHGRNTEEIARHVLWSMGIDPEPHGPLTTWNDSGLSTQYVADVISTAVASSPGASIRAGIGIDVHGHTLDGRSGERSAAACQAALAAGSDGLILCREYDEMRLDTLRAVGDALASPSLP